MNLLEKYEDILNIGQRYLYERRNNQVFNRENSELYSYEKGRFEGYLMACQMSYEIVGNSIEVFNKKGKKMFEVM